VVSRWLGTFNSGSRAFGAHRRSVAAATLFS
jgi:hypothetical protein